MSSLLDGFSQSAEAFFCNHITADRRSKPFSFHGRAPSAATCMKDCRHPTRGETSRTRKSSWRRGWHHSAAATLAFNHDSGDQLGTDALEFPGRCPPGRGVPLDSACPSVPNGSSPPPPKPGFGEQRKMPPHQCGQGASRGQDTRGTDEQFWPIFFRPRGSAGGDSGGFRCLDASEGCPY